MSYKKKNIFLLVSFILFLTVAWNLSYSETFKTKQKVDKLNLALAGIDSAPQEILKLRTELKQIEGNSKMLFSSVLEMRENLLSEISTLCSKHNVSLKSFPEFFTQERENFELVTSPIELSGSFKNLLTLMHEFEQNNHSGKISSAQFKIKETPRTKKRTLSLTLYIQSINI